MSGIAAAGGDMHVLLRQLAARGVVHRRDALEHLLLRGRLLVQLDAVEPCRGLLELLLESALQLIEHNRIEAACMPPFVDPATGRTVDAHREELVNLIQLLWGIFDELPTQHTALRLRITGIVEGAFELLVSDRRPHKYGCRLSPWNISAACMRGLIRTRVQYASLLDAIRARAGERNDPDTAAHLIGVISEGLAALSPAEARIYGAGEIEQLRRLAADLCLNTLTLQTMQALKTTRTQLARFCQRC